MSEKNSRFVKVFGSIVAGLVIAMFLGSISFALATSSRVAKIETIQEKTVKDVDTMRTEWREDQKEINQQLKEINEKLNNKEDRN